MGGFTPIGRWHWLPRCPKLPIQLPLVISDPSLSHPFYHALLRDGSTQPSHSAPSKINLPFAPLEVLHVLLYIYSTILVVCWKPSLIVDFSKAFDIANHNIWLPKISALDLPYNMHDWIVSILIGRQQRCVINGDCSSVLCITCGIIQGSGVGPTF